jgi:predicted nucleic acid-binding protein
VEVAFYDTSALVAGLVPAHPEYTRCRPLIDRARAEPGEHRCTQHALAEAFRVLVALPIRPPLAKEAARALVAQTLTPHLDPMALIASDYAAAFDLVCGGPLGAGAIYDALHLVAARRAKAQRLVTLNLRHFRALVGTAQGWPEIDEP